MTQLAPTNDTIVLASEALLEVMPANEIGLLLQHFDAAKLNTIQQTLAAAAEEEQHRVTVQATATGKMGKARGKTSQQGPGAAASAASKVKFCSSSLCCLSILKPGQCNQLVDIRLVPLLHRSIALVTASLAAAVRCMLCHS